MTNSSAFLNKEIYCRLLLVKIGSQIDDGKIGTFVQEIKLGDNQ